MKRIIIVDEPFVFDEDELGELATDMDGIVFNVPDEAAKVYLWLLGERSHQVAKFDYGPEDEKHAREGLTEESWFWQRAVLNYGQRVRIFGVIGDAKLLGVQALLKIVSSLAAQVEHLLRAGDIKELPKAGLSSGNLE